MVQIYSEAKPLAQVLGLGKSGSAAAQLLRSQHYRVQVFDTNCNEVLKERQQELEAHNIAVYLQRFPDFTDSELPELLVVSPGIAWYHPTLETARQLGIKVIGEVELAWQYLNHLPWVGITGTNGKSTTTALIASIFQTAGLRAIACGNIGLPICAVALDYLKGDLAIDWIVAELSSYQIEASPSVSPRIGVWTTFTPDHLDRHGTLERYSQIKASLLQRSQQAILNRDDAYLACIKSQWQGAIYTSIHDHIRDGYVVWQNEQLFPISQFQLLGDHNLQNLLLAVATARLAGIDPQHISRAVAQFQGMPHRLEMVAEYENLVFINDSKATNYDSSAVALRAVTPPVILIAGGQAKAGVAEGWLKLIQEKVAKVLLIGTASKQFAEMLSQVGYTDYWECETLENAINQAVLWGRSLGAKVTVLFSPACASFDQFANFEQRGDRFRALCQALCPESQ
jgi:UDP-N-acetylmuramoylalanine--D-glutamate ligase